MGHLTRAEMEEVIRQGGSVLHNNYTHTSIDTLPTIADLALGDVEAENAADDALDSQITQLLAQRKKLAVEREQRAAREKQANRAKLDELRAQKKERALTDEEEREIALRERRIQGNMPPSEEGLQDGDADHAITELPDTGDRITEEERQEEHAQAVSGLDLPEGEPGDAPDRESGEADHPRARSGRRAAGDGDKGSTAKKD